MRFDWDPEKNASNKAKHSLEFEEAATLFTSGVDYLEIFDERHSGDEERFLAIGPIRRGVVLVVWTIREDDRVRIISARMATRREAGLYQQYIEGK